MKNTTGPNLSDDPITNTVGGIIVGYNTVDANWFIWHSNGDGVTAVSKDPLSTIPVATGFVAYRIEMGFISGTNVLVNVYNSSDVILESATINTNMLSSGKSINWFHCIQNATTSPSKGLTCYKAVCE